MDQQSSRNAPYLIACLFAGLCLLCPGTQTTASSEVSQKTIRRATGAAKRITFSFQSAPWEVVLQWVARISDRGIVSGSIPKGHLNLIVRRSVSRAEARDIVNGELYHRGFTMLVDRRRLKIIKLVKHDKRKRAPWASLVPRIASSDLDHRGDHEFVRCSLEASSKRWVENSRTVLGQFANVSHLPSLGELEMVGRAGRIRWIRDQIQQERSPASRRSLVKEFPLNHTRAEVIVRTVQQLVHAEVPQYWESQLLTRVVSIATGRAKRDKNIKLPGIEGRTLVQAFRGRRNSIFAFAPPEQMDLIRQAIAKLDAPVDPDRVTVRQRPESYSLNELADPSGFMLSLTSDLSANAKWERDSGHNVVVVMTSPKEHDVLRRNWNRFRRGRRRLRAIPLTVLRATAVARSLPAALGIRKQSGNRKADQGNQFHAESDSDSNRLLLVASDSEFARVRDFLSRLGETESAMRSAGSSALVPSRSTEESRRIVEILRRLGPQLGPNAVRFHSLEKDSRPKPKSRNQP